MAVDISITAPFNNTGGNVYQIRLYVRRSQTDAANNRSAYAWQLWAEHVSGVNQRFTLNPVTWGVTVGGDSFYPVHNFDPRSGPVLIGEDTTNWFSHASDGTLTIPIRSWVNDVPQFGSADTGWRNFVTDKLSRVPAQPNSPAITNIQPTSFRVTSAVPASPTDPITRYQFAYGTSPTGAGHTIETNAGRIHDITGLTPGTLYYVRTRAENAAGWGPWSPFGNAKTISGAYVSDGSSWRPCEVFLSTGSSWPAGLVQVSDGSSWKPAG